MNERMNEFVEYMLETKALKMYIARSNNTTSVHYGSNDNFSIKENLDKQ
jgi:hypothetical protein